MNWIAFRKQLSREFSESMVKSAWGYVLDDELMLDRQVAIEFGWALTMGGEMNR